MEYALKLLEDENVRWVSRLAQPASRRSLTLHAPAAHAGSARSSKRSACCIRLRRPGWRSTRSGRIRVCGARNLASRQFPATAPTLPRPQQLWQAVNPNMPGQFRRPCAIGRWRPARKTEARNAAQPAWPPSALRRPRTLRTSGDLSPSSHGAARAKMTRGWTRRHVPTPPAPRPRLPLQTSPPPFPPSRVSTTSLARISHLLPGSPCCARTRRRGLARNRKSRAWRFRPPLLRCRAACLTGLPGTLRGPRAATNADGTLTRLTRI
jgi:hypothetical protein